MSSTLFTMMRGDDTAFRLRVQDNNSNPVDIRGWSFRATVKPSTGSPDPDPERGHPGIAVDIPALAGDASSDAANGLTMLLLPAEQSATLPEGVHEFDVQREFLDQVVTVIRGRVRVVADVTQRTAASIAAKAAAEAAAAEAAALAAENVESGTCTCAHSSCTRCNPYT